MIGLVHEIDRETREHGIHRGDLPEPPTPVRAEPAGGQLHQWINMLEAQLPC